MLANENGIDDTNVVEKISEVFYQSLLCPTNSTYKKYSDQADYFSFLNKNRTIEGWVKSHCKCDAGYSVWNGACLPTCSELEYRNSLGVCTVCNITDFSGRISQYDGSNFICNYEEDGCYSLSAP